MLNIKQLNSLKDAVCKCDDLVYKMFLLMLKGKKDITYDFNSSKLNKENFVTLKIYDSSCPEYREITIQAIQIDEDGLVDLITSDDYNPVSEDYEYLTLDDLTTDVLYKLILAFQTAFSE